MESLATLKWGRMRWGRRKSGNSSSVFSRVFSGSWFPRFKPRAAPADFECDEEEGGSGAGNRTTRFYSLEEADADWMVPVIEKRVVQGRRSTGGITHTPRWGESEYRFRASGFDPDSSPRRDGLLDFSDLGLEKTRAVSRRTRPTNHQQHPFQSPRREVKKMRSGRESFAMVKSSCDPEKDFRESIVEMIRERGILGKPKEIEELLACYLMLNSEEYHDLIIGIFRQVWAEMNRNQAQLLHLLRPRNWNKPSNPPPPF